MIPATRRRPASAAQGPAGPRATSRDVEPRRGLGALSLAVLAFLAGSHSLAGPASARQTASASNRLTGTPTAAPGTDLGTGLAALARRLGVEAMPTGRGVRAGQVEVGEGLGFAPDANDAELLGVILGYASGVSGTSVHATEVARWWYGQVGGLAPGLSEIDAYSAVGWLGSDFLHGSGSTPPELVNVKVFNNSWHGSTGAGDNAYLRKLDRAVNEQGLLIVGGTANGVGPLVWPLVSHGFNGIAVGRADGAHGAGRTLPSVDGPGRMKPEVVGPAPFTSFATPLVSGALTLLVETARTHPLLAADRRADRPEVLKAVLLAGARHPEGWSNHAGVGGVGGVERGAGSRPLDEVLGTGVLDVDRAHWILTGGGQPAAAEPASAPLAPPAGWSLMEVVGGTSSWVRLWLERPKPFLSVLATWNREVDAAYGGFAIPDIDLQLWRVDQAGAPTSLLGEAGRAHFAAGNVLSASRVDNVEHLFVRELQAGEYLIEVRRPIDGLPPWSLALAWDAPCEPARPFGRGKVVSRGSEPRLSARGYPARFAQDFTLLVEGGVPGGLALPIVGRAPALVSLEGGVLLVAGARTLPPVLLDAYGCAEIPIPIVEGMEGTTLTYQVLLRDPQQRDGTALATTNGLEVGFCP